MVSNERIQAVLLLTGVFAGKEKSGVQPLKNREWALFASWLGKEGKKPEDIFKSEIHEFIAGCSIPDITLSRLSRLLERSAQLGILMEKWFRQGIKVIIRSHDCYPRALKKLLREKAPPLLYVLGNQALLNSKAYGIVGSRRADSEDLQFAADLGKCVVQEGFSVVSGAAKGIDEAALTGALELKGTAIGIPATGISRPGRSSIFRQHIIDGNLVLFSPCHPDSPFSVGNAMARNKLIYCMSQATVAVCSTEGSGGTWQGARENLRSKWVPLWVKQTDQKISGNRALVEQGGTWLLNDPARAMKQMLQQSTAQKESDSSTKVDLGPLFQNSTE